MSSYVLPPNAFTIRYLLVMCKYLNNKLMLCIISSSKSCFTVTLKIKKLISPRSRNLPKLFREIKNTFPFKVLLEYSSSHPLFSAVNLAL